MRHFRRSFLLVATVIVGIASPAGAQTYTLAPYAQLQFFTNTASVCNGCLLNAYLAGTSTRRDTYSDTAGTANANPVVLSSAGRATVYLATGVSYRLVLTDSTAATTYFDIDPVAAVPSSSGSLDVTSTAGETLAAGDVVYLSDGTGSLTAGRWYRTDADNTYASSTASLVGIATAAIASAASGAIRIAGRITGLSGLTTGELYYASATAAALTVTPPTNQRFIGEADTTTSLVLHGDAGAVKIPDSDGTNTLAFITTSNLTADRRVSIQAGDSNRQITLSGDPTLGNNDTSTSGSPVFNNLTLTGTCTGCSPNRPLVPGGRCTLTTGTAVTVSDVTAATTLYYALYSRGGGRISLYDGTSIWTDYALTELSISVPAAASTMYDVFVYDNAGTRTLELTAWTNDTTRATAVVAQNGMLVRSGATTRLYVCSFRTTTVAGQTEDSYARRFVWNYYHRVPRPMRVLEATASWAYTTDTWRQANAATANQLDFVVGVNEEMIEATVLVNARHSLGAVRHTVGIGLDSTTAPATGNLVGWNGATETGRHVLASFLRTFPGIGRHTVTWLERSEASGTTTWEGASGSGDQSGISGWING